MCTLFGFIFHYTLLMEGRPADFGASNPSHSPTRHTRGHPAREVKHGGPGDRRHEHAQAALRKVAQVPWDQLDEQVQLWACQVREASYDMEDVLDTFLVRVQGPESAEQEQSLLKSLKAIFKKSKARRKVSTDANNIMAHLEEVTERCRRYKVDDIVANPATASTIDPRLPTMYTQVNKLVGLKNSSGELMSKLQLDDMSNTKMNTVSIVGVGGLGKTTLAKVVYDKIKGDFGCKAFVPVGRNPDLKKILKDILIDLDVKDENLHSLDERQLIDRLREFFVENKKRFLIVIDDIWETESWQTIKLALDDDNNCGGIIIITTRNMEVATKANEVYKLQPLAHDSSLELLYARIYGHEERHVDSQPDEISDKFIRKCGGIPLAIITMASLLVGKPREKWSEVYNTIDFGSKDNKDAQNTMRILSFSYYDLPSHLRTCWLYLSAFPEDSVIDKGSLVWMWVAEGFIHKKEGIRLFEIGEGYFNDLINRSMIQPVESDYDGGIIIGCRVHDVVLDFIRSMSEEEMFFTVVDHEQDTLLQSNNVIRRQANHNRTTVIGHTHHQTNHSEMAKLRSFIALRCVTDERWASLSSFTLLRVLAIENCKPRDGSRVRVEELGHLLHLRFLSLSGTRISGIPKEIGGLGFLQTLDLWETDVSEFSLNCSLPKQLACLHSLLLEGEDCYLVDVFSVEGTTSLEELSLQHVGSRLLKDLGSLRELRVLSLGVIRFDGETERDLVESLEHLQKLQSLDIGLISANSYGKPWQPTGLELSSHLRYLDVGVIHFCRLPSCINPRCLGDLYHLVLRVKQMDDQDLKNLGRLPELRFLELRELESSATISNISDSDAAAGYFPKLRHCRLPESTVLFIVNKEDKKMVSFHIWNGEDDIGIVPFDSDDESERPTMPSDSDEELQSPTMPSVSDDELPRRPIQKLQPGRLAAIAYYLLAVFHLVLAFVKKRWSIFNSGSTAAAPNGEVPIAIAMPSVSDEHDLEKNVTIASKGAAAAPPFMPSLQVLEFEVGHKGRENHPNCCDNLGLEYLSSLRAIHVLTYGNATDKVDAALRRTAQVHPNHPTIYFG